MLRLRKLYQAQSANSRGFTLIEVLIALAILAIVAVGFLSALTTASMALILADERTTAESLTRAQLEYVKSQDYSSAPWSYELPSDPPSWDPSHTLPNGYSGYSLTVDASLIHPMDDGIQKITVSVYHSDTPDESDLVLTTTAYKVNRNGEET